MDFVAISDEDRIWSRACEVDQSDGGNGIGDRHLQHLIRADGAVMSGGVGFAADVLSDADFAAAVDASLYFGLEELAVMWQSIAASSPEDDDELQAAYDVIDQQHLIERAFRRQLAIAPNDFEPL